MRGVGIPRTSQAPSSWLVAHIDHKNVWCTYKRGFHNCVMRAGGLGSAVSTITAKTEGRSVPILTQERGLAEHSIPSMGPAEHSAHSTSLTAVESKVAALELLVHSMRSTGADPDGAAVGGAVAGGDAAALASLETKLQEYGKVLQAMRNRIIALQVRSTADSDNVTVLTGKLALILALFHCSVVQLNNRLNQSMLGHVWLSPCSLFLCLVLDPSLNLILSFHASPSWPIIPASLPSIRLPLPPLAPLCPHPFLKPCLHASSWPLDIHPQSALLPPSNPIVFFHPAHRSTWIAPRAW